MAEDARRVTGIELDKQAIAAARETAAQWGLQNIEFLDVPAEKVTEDLPHVDVAVVDPPRTGMDPTCAPRCGRQRAQPDSLPLL